MEDLLHWEQMFIYFGALVCIFLIPMYLYMYSYKASVLGEVFTQYRCPPPSPLQIILYETNLIIKIEILAFQ